MTRDVAEFQFSRHMVVAATAYTEPHRRCTDITLYILFSVIVPEQLLPAPVPLNLPDERDAAPAIF